MGSPARATRTSLSSGNGGYDVHHYDLTLGYDPHSRHLDGKAVITARATQRLTRFDLDLNGLKVTGVTVDHAKAAFRRDGQELVVTPQRALRKGQEFRVTVTYSGTPEAGHRPRRLPRRVDPHRRRRVRGR